MSETNNHSAILGLFEPFDDEWKSTTRSIRINGKVTSVRLENFYWRIIREIAALQDIAVPQLLTVLSKTAKSSESTTEHTNFTSFVRVCCGRYIQLKTVASDGLDAANPNVRLVQQDSTNKPNGPLPNSSLSTKE